MFKINQKVQVFLENNVCQEAKIVLQENINHYQVQWIEKKVTISKILHVSCIAPLPLPFKNKEVSTIKTLFVGLALSYCVPEILILL